MGARAMKMYTDRNKFSALVLNSPGTRNFINDRITKAVDGVEGVHKFMTGKKRAVGLIISTQTHDTPDGRKSKGKKHRARLRKGEKLDGLRRVTVAAGRLQP